LQFDPYGKPGVAPTREWSPNVFGTFRFVLATAVAVTHLSYWGWPGVYAVFGFYLISGYLMCLVLNQRYGFTPSGLWAYAKNRVLRIYPPYWVACAFTVGLIGLLGQPVAAQMYGPWQLPSSASEWLRNLTIVGLDPTQANLLVPPAWALRVELFYYTAMGLGLGRNRRIAIAWTLASVAYHVYLGVSGADWSERYSPIPAASLPFSVGALLYHYREEVGTRLRHAHGFLAVAIVIWSINLIWSPLAMGSVLGPGRFYLNIVCVFAIAAALCMRRSENPTLRRLDQRLGDLAYPIYLIHMQVGLWVLATGWTAPTPNPSLALLSFAPLLVVSWIVMRTVVDPLENVRGGIRQRFEGNRAPSR